MIKAINIFSAVLTCLLFATNIGYAQQNRLALGNWEAHLSYKNATSITQSDSTIFVGTRSSLFSYNIADNALRSYSPVDGLSDINISKVAYAPSQQTLIIAYKSGNIDLLTANKIININDIFRANIIADKTINNILIHGDEAYLATGFGIVVLNIATQELQDTYQIGSNGEKINVNQTAILRDTLYAATSQGLRYVPMNLPPNNFANWQTDSLLTNNAVQFVAQAKDLLYAAFNDLVYYKDPSLNSEWQILYGEADYEIHNLQASADNVVLSEWKNNSFQGRISVIANPQTIYEINNPLVMRPSQAITDYDGTVHIAEFFGGYTRLGGSGNITLVPNGPESANTFRLKADSKGRILLAPGQIDAALNYVGNNEGLQILDEFGWTQYNQYSFDGGFFDVLAATPVPTEDNAFYVGSFINGMAKLTIAGSQNESLAWQHFNKDNSSLQGAQGNENAIPVTDFANDPYGNVWIANFGALAPLSVLTPEGNFYSYQPDFYIDPEKSILHLTTDNIGQRWGVIPQAGVIVFNHGVELTDKTDDKYALLTTANGLPSNNPTAILVDKDDAVWIGTDAGIGIFYCPLSATDSTVCTAVRPLIEIDGFLDYLLANETITAMAVDGGNRKWIGTANGVFLLNRDGTEQLASFTTENSPLPDNQITALAYEGLSGKLFIGTAKGLVAYQTASNTTGNEHSEIITYPNPATPDYTGLISISGLAANANVKITDISGQLIYQTQAVGGIATWSGNTPDGKRAATGVYLIYSSNVDGSDSAVGKLMLIH